MLQDIHPHHFNNEFKLKAPRDKDYLLIFNEEKILMDSSSKQLMFTTVEQVKDMDVAPLNSVIYLFSIDDTSIFCAFDSVSETESFKYVQTTFLRELLPEWMVFVAATANQLAKWYDANRFCGRCATPLSFSDSERALKCSNCGLVRYPNINPAVIVAIVYNDKILLTRYADRPYKKLSLVAGFMEIGETVEDTISREVMEEVGLKVKNLKYFKSQPWAFSQSVLMGFFAELDGDAQVKLDKVELSEANWYSRENIPPCETTLSLTNEMIEAFRKNEVPYFIQTV